MTRKQLEGICRFVAMWNISSYSLEKINSEFGLKLTGKVSQEEALTAYLEEKKITLDKGIEPTEQFVNHLERLSESNGKFIALPTPEENLLDHFAGIALSYLLTTKQFISYTGNLAKYQMSKETYSIAKEMLKAREEALKNG